MPRRKMSDEEIAYRSEPIFQAIESLSNETWVRSEFSDRVEWYQDRYRRWLEIYRTYSTEHDLGNVSVWHAYSILSLGAYLARMTNCFHDAKSYLELLFTHPQIDSLEPVLLRIDLSCNLIEYLLELGEERKAIDLAYSQMEIEDPDARKFVHQFLAHPISLYLCTLDPQQAQKIASRDLTDLVRSIISHKETTHKAVQTKRKRNVVSAVPDLPETVTNAQLNAVLRDKMLPTVKMDKSAFLAKY